MGTVTRVTGGSRLVGLDLARTLALLAMVAAHLLRGVHDGEVTIAHQVVAGRSSGLFAVLAGVGLVLLARTRTPLHGTALRAELAAVWARCLGLGVLGLVIGGLVDSGMSVILTYYALLLAVAAPCLALRTRWIAAVGVSVLVVGPPLSQVVRSVLPPDPPGDPTLTSLLSPAELVADLVLTGGFPALTWLPFVLAGMVVGRLELRSPQVAQRLVAVGGALVVAAWVLVDLFLSVPAVASRLEASVARRGGPTDLDLALARGFKSVLPTDTWAWLLVRAPHSGAWFDQVNVIGSACLAIGLCLLVGPVLRGRLVLLTGAGTMTLTLYSLHMLARPQGLFPVPGGNLLLPHLLVLLAVGAIVLHLGRRGPLESLLARMSRVARAQVLETAARAPGAPGVPGAAAASPSGEPDEQPDGPEPSLR